MKTARTQKIILTLLLLPALVYLARAGVADYLRLAPCAYLETVQQGAVRLNPARLAGAKEQLLLAQGWDANNPVITEYLGQIALMRAQLASFSPRMQMVFLQEALEDYQAALRLRPNSAYLWAARMTTGNMMIETSARIGRDEALIARELPEIEYALQRAAALGPREPSVLQQVVKVGTQRYGELSVQERETVEDATRRAKQMGVVI